MKINKFNQLNESDEISYNKSLGYDNSMFDSLSELYKLWTDAEGLSHFSADEYGSEDLTDKQIDYLENFNDFWELTQDFEQDYHENGYALIKKTKKFNL